MNQPRLCSPGTPAPGQSSSVAGWLLPPSPQPPAPRPCNSQGWQPRGHAARCSTLRLSFSVYSFQIHSCCFLFGSLFCVMVFQLFFQSLPPPRGRGRIPKKTSFWRELRAHLLSSCSIPGGPRQGRWSWGARTRQAHGGWRAGSGPPPPNPVVEAGSGHEHCGRQG